MKTANDFAICFSGKTFSNPRESFEYLEIMFEKAQRDAFEQTREKCFSLLSNMSKAWSEGELIQQLAFEDLQK